MSRQVGTRRNTGSTIPRPNFGWVILRQLGLILIISLLVLPFSVNVSFSFVVGALIHVLPQALFALTAFLHMGARNIKKAYMSISQGMVAKFLLTAAALITVFKFWPSISLTALFIGYLLLQISSWILYPILINRPLSGGK